MNVIPPNENVGGFANTGFDRSVPVFVPSATPALTPVRRESAPALILAVKEIQKSYSIGGATRKVLDNVSFQACSGESVFLSGPSGSGKSTLLSIMGCLLKSDSGSIEIDGQRVDQMSIAERTLIRRESIGFVFQRFQLIQALSAEDNVALPLTLQGLSLPHARERAANLLRRVGLESHRRHLPSAMSPGQCQRVALARAIITKPKLILADEPTAALDGKSGIEVMELLQELISENDNI